MNRARPYIPLIGFVVPTVIVGYCVVIPRSCIAGINELSVGFGTTIVGAIFAYLAPSSRSPCAPSRRYEHASRMRSIDRLHTQADGSDACLG